MPVKELKFASEKSHNLLKAPAGRARTNKTRLALMLLATGLLTAFFSVPLYHLLRLAGTDDLYSDVPMIPLLSLYLVWLRRERMPASFEPAFKPAMLCFSAGLFMFAACWLSSRGTIPHAVENDLAGSISAFVLLFVGICCFYPGGAFVRVYACPMALLAFCVPLPVGLRGWIETGLQHGSAVFAGIFFDITGAPVIREGLNFHLPDIILQVAPECSGIHSTMVLTIVSIAAAWLFLRSPWKRAALVLLVIPLALIRNGFRIFVIGRLCMAYGPQMINSPIHRHGGPLFFALSLLPFFLALLLLRKTENPKLKLSTRRSL
jgi:exosortase C (VPDSG-CTERM-specific)